MTVQRPLTWDAGSRRLGTCLFIVGGIVAAAAPGLAAVGHQGHGIAPFPGFGLAAAFLFGLLGSLHCFGMCGPLVGLYASQLLPGSAPSASRQHLLFNLGRILAYTNLGVVFGGAGFVLGARSWVTALVGVAAGLFVLAMGARFLGAGGAASWLDRLLARPTGALLGVWRRYLFLARSSGIVLLGAVHGLLPCPLLYVMLTSAVALGDPIQGGTLLLSFSLGTVPMMWGMGALGARLGAKRRLTWHRVFGWAVTAWGLVLVVRGLQDLGTF